MDRYEAIIDKQLEAYNLHDTEDFLRCYAEDVRGIDIDIDKVVFSSREAMRPRYSIAFGNKYLHCDIQSRMKLGRTIVDYERITINENNETFDSIVIYDINEDGLIGNVRFSKGKRR